MLDTKPSVSATLHNIIDKGLRIVSSRHMFDTLYICQWKHVFCVVVRSNISASGLWKFCTINCSTISTYEESMFVYYSARSLHLLDTYSYIASWYFHSSCTTWSHDHSVSLQNSSWLPKGPLAGNLPRFHAENSNLFEIPIRSKLKKVGSNDPCLESLAGCW